MTDQTKHTDQDKDDTVNGTRQVASPNADKKTDFATGYPYSDAPESTDHI